MIKIHDEIYKSIIEEYIGCLEDYLIGRMQSNGEIRGIIKEPIKSLN